MTLGIRAIVAAGIVVLASSPPPAAIAQAEDRTRTYYIAADEVDWDYAPSGANRITGQPFSDLENYWVGSAPDRIGRIYRKAIYREYTDGTFTQRKPRAAEWAHLGFLGPLIRAEVGDTIVVVFRNNAGFPASVHPHGVIYAKDSEGAPSTDGSTDAERADDAVPPGGTHTYVWPVPERAGPAEGDGSSVLWMYHSHTHEDADVNAGLFGPMIVTARGQAREDGSPTDVDREFVVSFHEVDENLSHYLEDNILAYAGDPASVDRSQIFFWQPFGGSNLMESMNGFVYGHLDGLEMTEGERVRWYLLSSTNFEIHAPHWHGNTVVANHMRMDVTALLPMGMLIADMVPDNPGTWLFHCHVGPHLTAGMQSVYTVRPADVVELRDPSGASPP